MSESGGGPGWAAFILIGSAVLIGGWLFLGPGSETGSEAGSERRSASGEHVAADSVVGMSLADAMGGDDPTGYARALEPREFEFPADHAAHPAFRTEWWYVTANLFGPDGRRFGTHFTIFRSALGPTVGGEPDAAPEAAPGAAPDESDAARAAGAWATNDVYMGHFAVADVEAGTFTESERFTRGSAGLAGTTTGISGRGDRASGGDDASGQAPGTSTSSDEASGPFRVWMDDWAMESLDAPRTGAEGIFPLRLVARDPDLGTAINLVVTPDRPVVLQGEDGLSQKGEEPGNASYYYSFTRMRAEGTVVAGGDTVAVTGQAWMDREWSTSALDATQEGWDWFALQLDEGRDLMVYRLRGTDGSTDPRSEGVVVEADGTHRRLASTDFELEVLETWESPIDGAVYPSTWRVTVPSEELDLRVEPVLRDQEMDVTVRYWEGAVDVLEAGRVEEGPGSTGASSDTGAIGRGYVELTGYGGAAPPGG